MFSLANLCLRVLFDMSGVHPIVNYTPKYHPDQIFYLLYAGVHLIRDYGHPGNLIPPTLTLAKLGCTPLTLDHTPGNIWTPSGAVMKGVRRKANKKWYLHEHRSSYKSRKPEYYNNFTIDYFQSYSSSCVTYSV